MKRISVKLAIAFIVLILLSSLLSFVTSAVFMPNLQHEIRESQEAIGTLIVDLSQKTDLTSQEIVEMTSWFTYHTRIAEAGEAQVLDEEDMETIKEGGMVNKQARRLHGVSTYFMLGDDLIQIQLKPDHTVWKMAASRIWFSGISFVIIGSILIIFVVRHSVRPIIKLTNATREIADGNFDVKIDHRSKDEIGQLTNNFNRMVSELKQMDTLRKDFVSNVSHEFKTPIASIQGFARLLQKDDLPEEDRKEYARIIVEESGRLSHLTSNMLKLSKLENQEIIQKHERFYLDEQIRKSILLLEPEWEKKEIRWDIELDRAMISGDEELLQQVWINLIGNAIKFSDQGGRILVELQHTREGVQIFVKDDGRGMTKQTKARIFEKFYQGEEAHGIEGSGLGLPLVKRIVDLHDGKVEVESEPEKGAAFTVLLPVQEIFTDQK